MSIPISQFITPPPPLPLSPLVSIHLFSTSLSLFLFCRQWLPQLEFTCGDRYSTVIPTSPLTLSAPPHWTSATSFQPPNFAPLILCACAATPLTGHRAQLNVTLTVTFPTMPCNVPPLSPSAMSLSTIFYRTHITVKNDLGNYFGGCFISVSPPRTKASWGQDFPVLSTSG